MNFKSINMNVVILIATMGLISILYGMYKNKTNKTDEEHHYELVREYLLNDSPLAQNKNPIIWIHLDYKINSREWLNFNSRNTNNLNQPYLYLTIKSIVDKCGEDFKICVIDDNTFVNLLPNWTIDLAYVASPIKDKLRTLALMNVLETYGGLLLPGSFFCKKNLKPLYDEYTKQDKLFVGDSLNTNLSAHDNNLFATNKIVGCKRDCDKMKDYINYLQILITNDYTNESTLIGSMNLWLEENVRNKEINMIKTKYFGLLTNDNKVITLDNLLSDEYIDIHDESYGIYIPDEEILERKKYQWFARISPEQILSSNTFIGRYIVSNLITEEELNKKEEEKNNDKKSSNNI